MRDIEDFLIAINEWAEAKTKYHQAYADREYKAREAVIAALNDVIGARVCIALADADLHKTRSDNP